MKKSDIHNLRRLERALSEIDQAEQAGRFGVDKQLAEWIDRMLADAPPIIGERREKLARLLDRWWEK